MKREKENDFFDITQIKNKFFTIKRFFAKFD